MWPAAGLDRVPAFGLLAADWTICNVGHFAVLSTLSLYLVVALRLQAPLAAALMMYATLCFRLTRFFTAPLVDRLEPRAALVLGAVLAGVGYAGMALTSHPAAMVVLLPLIGAGYGSSALVVKASAAEGRTSMSLVRYAGVSTALNVGAGIGPVLANTLFLHWNPRSVFLLASAMFVVTALIASRLPLAPPVQDVSRVWLRSLGATLALPRVRLTLLLVLLAFFLYSQLYATLPLMTRSLLHAPELLSTYFAVNALLMILGQVPASRLAAAWRVPPERLVRLSYVLYSAGFGLLWLLPYWPVAYGAIGLWTGAEILMLPSLDTLMAAAVPAGLRVIAFSLSAAAIGVGEGLGGLLGVLGVGTLVHAGHLALLYGCFALLAAAFAGVGTLACRRLSADA